MGQKLKIAGWVSIGVVAGALTTVQLQAVARGGLAPLPLEELQQLANGVHQIREHLFFLLELLRQRDPAIFFPAFRA